MIIVGPLPIPSRHNPPWIFARPWVPLYCCIYTTLLHPCIAWRGEHNSRPAFCLTGATGFRGTGLAFRPVCCVGSTPRAPHPASPCPTRRLGTFLAFRSTCCTKDTLLDPCTEPPCHGFSGVGWCSFPRVRVGARPSRYSQPGHGAKQAVTKRDRLYGPATRLVARFLADAIERVSNIRIAEHMQRASEYPSKGKEGIYPAARRSEPEWQGASGGRYWPVHM